MSILTLNTAQVRALQSNSEWAHTPQYLFIDDFALLLLYAEGLRDELRKTNFHSATSHSLPADLNLYFLEDGEEDDYEAWTDSDNIRLGFLDINISESSFIISSTFKHTGEDIFFVHYFGCDEPNSKAEALKVKPEQLTSILR
jgi:hypothetical protein